MTWGTRNGFHVSFSKRLKAGNPKSQRGSREAKIENDAPGVRPRAGGSSRHGIYRWISVSSPPENHCFWNPCEINKWWRTSVPQNHMDLQWFLQWFDRDRESTVFFFQKRVPLKITEDFGLNLSGQESGEIAQQPACFDVAVSHQGGVSFWTAGEPRKGTQWQDWRPHQDEWMIMDEPSSQDILEPLEFS